MGCRTACARVVMKWDSSRFLTPTRMLLLVLGTFMTYLGLFWLEPMPVVRIQPFAACSPGEIHIDNRDSSFFGRCASCPGSLPDAAALNTSCPPCRGYQRTSFDNVTFRAAAAGAGGAAAAAADAAGCNCTDCATEALCTCDTQLWCHPGRWSWASNARAQMYECTPHRSCLGVTPEEPCGCGTGYKGVLCGECADGYVNTNGYCRECGDTGRDPNLVIAEVLALGLLYALVLVFAFVRMLKILMVAKTRGAVTYCNYEVRSDLINVLNLRLTFDLPFLR